MLSRILLTVAVALTCVVSAVPASAQPDEQRSREPRREQPDRDRHPDARQPSRQDQARDNRDVRDGSDDRRGSGEPGRFETRRDDGPGDHGRGAGPDRRFHRGERLSADYRRRQYAVDDWRGHHLSAPPRGHRWVQVGADYVLIAAATGVIAQVLLNH